MTFKALNKFVTVCFVDTHFRLKELTCTNILEDSNFDFRYPVCQAMWFSYSERKMVELFANSRDPDQTLHSAASDLGLHCLPITISGVSLQQWVKSSLLRCWFWLVPTTYVFYWEIGKKWIFVILDHWSPFIRYQTSLYLEQGKVINPL